ncbi:MAG: anti-virulence regulator CigR family protein [Pseudomonas sp.]
MSNSRTVIAVLTSIALITGSPALLADPGNGKGKPHANQAQQGSSAGNDYKGQEGSSDWGRGPQIDIGGIRVILDGNREYWGPGQALPPGIQKNLARGKPLPPGIAKKLDSRLLGRLPHYAGYDWVQAGTDLILVAVATGLIYEVLHDALD